MKRVCSYCKCDLGSVAAAPESDERITHGICRKCLDTVMAGYGEPLDEFLDSLQIPVLLVDNDVRVLSANALARRMLSPDALKIKGLLGGELFRCKNYDQPGGCGKTLHCQTCTIRNCVTRTFETGENCDRVPACLDLDVIAGPRRVSLVISTEKANDAVFLRIDKAEHTD